MTTIVEFNQLSGSIEYSYIINPNDVGETRVYIEKFYTLNEFLHLITKEKLDKIRMTLRASKVTIDAICLNTGTSDSKEKVEFLLMKDVFFGQSIRTS